MLPTPTHQNRKQSLHSDKKVLAPDQKWKPHVALSLGKVLGTPGLDSLTSSLISFFEQFNLPFSPSPSNMTKIKVKGN